jgi:hypothetical protein
MLSREYMCAPDDSNPDIRPGRQRPRTALVVRGRDPTYGGADPYFDVLKDLVSPVVVPLELVATRR